MQKRSCTTNLLEHTSFIARELEKKEVKQVDVIYTDFSKAFDRVPISVVEKALECYGVCGHLLNWLSSYLRTRKQYVQFKNIRSEIFVAKSGVPQGSHCGPTLYNLVANFASNS